MEERKNRSSPDLRKALARIAIEQDRRLNRAAVSVASALISHANLDTGRCDPGLDRLAKETRYGRHMVSKAINKLIGCGWLERIRHGGQRHTNKYLINWNALVAAGMDWEIEAGLRQPATPVAGSDVTDVQPATPVTSTRDSSLVNPRLQSHQNLEGNPEGKRASPKLKKNGFEVSGCTAQAKPHHPNAPSDPLKRAIQEAARKPTPESRAVARDRALGRLEQDLLSTSADCYTAALEKLTQETWDRATAAELKTRGEGCRVALEALEASQ